ALDRRAWLSPTSEARRLAQGGRGRAGCRSFTGAAIMRWQDYRRSDNVEEGSSSGPSMFGGGLRLSAGAIILVVVVSLLLGKNPLEMLALLTGDGGGPVVQTQAPQTAPRAPAANDPQTEFVARVLGDTEDVWGGIFQQMG